MKDISERNYISRREFLKLAASFTIFGTRTPKFIEGVDRLISVPNRKNIIIILFDAMSAQHMSLYGYPRQTTPNIDRFAERATVYHKHYAGGNFTTPGTASLFTGTYPWFHRALHMHGTILEEHTQKNLFNLLPPEIYKIAYTHNLLSYSLMQQFKDAIDHLKKPRELALFDPQYSDRIFPSDYNISYTSEAVALRSGEIRTNPTSLLVTLLYRIYRLVNKRSLTNELGFLFPKGIPNLNDIYFILEDCIDWTIDTIKNLPQPFLLFFHPLPPHEPYFTRREFIDRFKDDYKPLLKPDHIFSDGYDEEHLSKERREYDEYLVYADEEFGRLYEFMEKNDVFENSFVIFTSDHGEMFERGIRGHVTRTLYEPIIRVPLIISKPGQKKREDVYKPTSCVDLLPTLLHIYDQPIPDWCEGEIIPTINTSPIKSDREIYSIEAKSNPKFAPLKKATVALIKDDFKLIKYMGYNSQGISYECFNLKEDPDELHNLCSSNNMIAAELIEIMEKKLAQVNQPFEKL